jgi:hypothetical protein
MEIMPELQSADLFRVPHNWFDLEYLLKGTHRQQAAYRALSKLKIDALLADYNPVLAGTIPLQLDLPGSDLDILCEFEDRQGFARCLTLNFGRLPGFSIVERIHQELPTILGRFDYLCFPIEIFGQPLAVQKQRAFRHMFVEARLLQIGGESARQAIVELKKSGMKTEPAFGEFFNLPGDPYQTLLELADLSQPELLALLDIYREVVK